jgi:hypothetical protein
MDVRQAELLRDVLAGTGWVERTVEFARAMRVGTRTPGGLLLFGTPTDEPWHLTAHLDDEARLNDIPELKPTLVRWNPPPDAAPHLAIGLDRLSETRRGESLVVVAESASVPLLERVDDVRRKGANVFALDTGDRELSSLANEVLTVPADDDALLTFEGAQHLVSLAAGQRIESGRQSFRARLGRLLDLISGPPR